MAEDNIAVQTNNDTAKGNDAVSNTPDTTLLTGDKPAEAQATKPEGQTDAQKKVEGQKPQEGAPESYEAFKTPEGVAIEAEMLTKFQTVAKELNLSQEKAQKVIDLAIDHVEQLNKASQAQFVQTRKEWVDSIRADKDFGGLKLNENLEHAQRVLRKFGSPELTNFLNLTGAGDNPEVFKMLSRIGRAIGEDKLVDGKSTSMADKSAAEIIYPSQK